MMATPQPLHQQYKLTDMLSCYIAQSNRNCGMLTCKFAKHIHVDMMSLTWLKNSVTTRCVHCSASGKGLAGLAMSAQCTHMRRARLRWSAPQLSMSGPSSFRLAVKACRTHHEGLCQSTLLPCTVMMLA